MAVTGARQALHPSLPRDRVRGRRAASRDGFGRSDRAPRRRCPVAQPVVPGRGGARHVGQRAGWGEHPAGARGHPEQLREPAGGDLLDGGWSGADEPRAGRGVELGRHDDADDAENAENAENAEKIVCAGDDGEAAGVVKAQRPGQYFGGGELDQGGRISRLPRGIPERPCPPAVLLYKWGQARVDGHRWSPR